MLGPLVISLRLDNPDRRLHRLGAWSTGGFFKKLQRQPAPEALGSNRPCFAMTIDIYVGERCAIRRMEELSSAREVEKNISLRRGPPAAAEVTGQRLVECCYPASRLLEPIPQRLEGRQVFALQCSEPFQHVRHERCAGIVGGFFDQISQRIGGLFVPVVAVLVDDFINVRRRCFVFHRKTLGRRSPASSPARIFFSISVLHHGRLAGWASIWLPAAVRTSKASDRDRRPAPTSVPSANDCPDNVASC